MSTSIRRLVDNNHNNINTYNIKMLYLAYDDKFVTGVIVVNVK